MLTNFKNKIFTIKTFESQPAASNIVTVHLFKGVLIIKSYFSNLCNHFMNTTKKDERKLPVTSCYSYWH